MPANPLNSEQLAEAAKLHMLFKKWQARRRDAGLPGSQDAACELLGFGQSSLSQYLNGKIPLNLAAATKFAHLIGGTVAEFSPSLASQAIQYRALADSIASESDAHALSDARRVVAVTEARHEVTPIKRVSLTLRAGITGFDMTQDHCDGSTLDVPTQWIEENDLVPHCLIALPVKGESMQPLLFEKDIVIINIADTKRVNGGVYAFNFNGEAVIKRLAYERQEWYLSSDNPAFKKAPCRHAECIIVGRVVRFEAVNFRDRL